MSLLRDRIREAWTHLGQVRPHHSVLTRQDYLPESINEESIESFYASGVREVSTIDAILRRHGFSHPELKICVEYGCGLGRVTFALATMFKTIHAYDISPNHLTLARRRAAEKGLRNVQFHLCSADAITEELEPCDFFYSCIVFQHNPPPIMRELIAASLRSLRAGGVAIFQAPIYGTGYSFRIKDYLAGPQQLDIEMHCIPQQTVFSLIAEADCRVLEVREDGWIGAPGRWISNTFVVQRFASPASEKKPPRSKTSPA
jgi:SAM-dependent methyltransferase